MSDNSILISQGEKIREPFRRGLGYAAQWLDGLRVLVEKKVEEALTVSDQTLQQEKDVISLKTDTGVNLETSPDENGDPDLVECTRFLRQLCPACFGGSSFGRPLEEYAFFFF